MRSIAGAGDTGDCHDCSGFRRAGAVSPSVMTTQAATADMTSPKAIGPANDGALGLEQSRPRRRVRKRGVAASMSRIEPQQQPLPILPQRVEPDQALHHRDGLVALAKRVRPLGAGLEDAGGN
jgi:hypothetical protein